MISTIGMSRVDLLVLLYNTAQTLPSNSNLTSFQAEWILNLLKRERDHLLEGYMKLPSELHYALTKEFKELEFITFLFGRAIFLNLRTGEIDDKQRDFYTGIDSTVECISQLKIAIPRQITLRSTKKLGRYHEV